MLLAGKLASLRLNDEPIDPLLSWENAPVLSQAITVINGKGGVGKTSVTANLGGLAAAAGYKTLLVDMDPQGNLSRDLGIRQAGNWDRGYALCEALMTRGGGLEPVRDVRPNLDVICGGPEMEDLADYLASRRSRGGNSYRALYDALYKMASAYHLILIDSPPGERLLQINALTAAHFALIPVKSDDGSADGLERIAKLFQLIREGDDQMHATNPSLDLLGVVVFDVGTGSRAIRRQTREQIEEELGQDGIVFPAMIRHVEGQARETRRRGRLAHELEMDTARPQRGAEEDLRSAATGLATDYAMLTGQVLERWLERRQPPTATDERSAVG